MRVTVTIKGFYDWTPVPDDVTITERDKTSGKVKQSFGGQWLMRVPREDAPTHTETGISEDEIIDTILTVKMREKHTMNRAAAASRVLSRLMGDEAHPKWMQKFEVHDDGPQPDRFVERARQYVEAGHLQDEHIEDLVDAYGTPFDHDELAQQFETHFGVKPTKKGG